MEESSTLHPQSNTWILYSWLGIDGLLLARDPDLKSSRPCCARYSCVSSVAATGLVESLLTFHHSFNGGAASILCSFPNPNQTNQGFLFFQEFMVDAFLGFIIWAVLDPANPFVSPVSAPFTIGLAYAVMVWGFAANTISTNLARDLGTRFVAAIFFGREAFNANNGYSWISILVNIPATIVATTFYELM